jgi:conjugative relaxase-like TrwC/TraI family protein
MNGNKGVIEQIMKHHIYGGLKFRNKLANGVKDIGYELAVNSQGLWEIKGVPESLMTHFSKRRQDIEAVKEENGWQGAKASSIAAQKTKVDQELIDIEGWCKDILQECHEFGFNLYHGIRL